MGFMDHIITCNRRDLSRFRPFYAGDKHVGWVSHSFAADLISFPETVTVMPDAVAMAGHLRSPEERTQALGHVLTRLVADGRMARLRNEPFSVATSFGGEEVMRIDRSAVPLFGIRAFGVHMNGYVRTEDGLKLWIARRSPVKRVAPGKLDNIVAGGQPAGLSLRENLIKECKEEADIPRELAIQAVPVGAITYCMEDGDGLKSDGMFCYDLELPPDFVPRPNDDEVESFMLWPIAKAIETVRTSDEFKFNVNLVIIDFAIRHGLITPDDESHYLDLLLHLRGPVHPQAGHTLVTVPGRACVETPRGIG